MEAWAEQPPPDRRPAPSPSHRLAIAGMDSDRIIHVQDRATLRNPDYGGEVVEITLAGHDPIHVGVLADEAVIIVTVRRSDLWELAACIVPSLGTIEGGG